MQKYQGMEFYEHDETINLPKSFKLIVEYKDGYMFGNHTYGRLAKWEFVEFFNRYGWVVRKMKKSDHQWKEISQITGYKLH